MPEGAPITTIPQNPRTRDKIFFWGLLGMLSTAFAEVTAGSSPFPFFHPWGLIVTTPLYTLHVVLLAGLLSRSGRLTAHGLLFAGAIFGLYEAYITKVLWSPDWGSSLPRFAEVSWLHVILLVLWWHPLLAFILPLGLAEALMTRSREVLDCLPERWRARIDRAPGRAALLLALACGVLASANAPTPVFALLSPLANACLLGGLLMVWQRRGPGQVYTLEALLPGVRGTAALGMLLAAFYGLAGAAILPERLPGPAGHAAILVCYALFAVALYRSTRATITVREAIPPSPTLPRMFAGFALASACAGLLSKLLLGPASVIVLLAVWGAACTVGVYLYGRALLAAFRPHRDYAAPSVVRH
jgi:hypothetical protein